MYKIISQNTRSILCLVFALCVAFYPSTLAFAATTYSFTEPPALSGREKAHRNIIFTGEGNTEETCTEDSSAITLVGADNLEKIFNYLIGKGLSPEQAAGAVGNISVESGGDPQIIQGGKRTNDPSTISSGWGIIQWTPGSKIIGLLSQANITSPVYELVTQLELVWWHMNNTSPTGAQNMYAKYKTITDVAEATTVFENEIEGAGTPHLSTRIERAKEALREYGGGGSTTGSDTPVTNSGGCSSDEGGGIASANGFTFPLITTQNAITSNKPYPWCYEKLTNCHHDYKAADIMIPTGTTVIAAKSGIVQNTNQGNQHPNNVTITSSDGQGINYYTHMGANTVKLRVGQKVAAGDVLGKVGTSVDAMGTPPHLHFDMLPPKYKYRPSCSGSSCSGYPFIEVQPALTETFKKLPKG